jgi:hypothetical protein
MQPEPGITGSENCGAAGLNGELCDGAELHGIIGPPRLLAAGPPVHAPAVELEYAQKMIDVPI